MEHYQFLFEQVNEAQRAVLIAQLDAIGFEGYEEEGMVLKAFVEVDKFQPDMFDNLFSNNHIKYSKSIIKERNWNSDWESNFEPVVVLKPDTQQPFVLLRAGFHEPVAGVDLELVITPKMSFGTGHHATTYQMIQQMSLLDFSGKDVIDFGTGTAVLAILAEKMGAKHIVAIDYDDWSISNALENTEANHCSAITLVKAETIEMGYQADIILANINLNIILGNLEAIIAACKPGCRVLFSGIMGQDKNKITSELESAGFTIDSCLEKDNWLVIGTQLKRIAG
ncbi:MAG: 50S ribosomal protein L11 methyltransferase [Bacteroidetes bacterium]|nr:50S ribosomal protein L11 methyltransferase [Bacteroidota bacterium]